MAVKEFEREATKMISSRPSQHVELKNADTAVRPEDILPEDENYTVISGVRVRKGSIAAVLRNASLLASPLAGQAEKEEAKKIIAELAPGLVVLGMYEHVIWNNPDIQKIIEVAAEKLQERK